MLNFTTAPESLCRPSDSGSSQPALEEQQLLEAGLRCRFEPPQAACSERKAHLDMSLVFAPAAPRGGAERLDQDGSGVKIVLEDHRLLPHAFFFQPRLIAAD